MKTVAGWAQPDPSWPFPAWAQRAPPAGAARTANPRGKVTWHNTPLHIGAFRGVA